MPGKNKMGHFKRISTPGAKIWAKLKWGSATKTDVPVGNFGCKFKIFYLNTF